MPSVLISMIEDMFVVMRSGDFAEFQRFLARLAYAGPRQTPADLTEGVERLAVELPGLGGVYAKVAVLAGAFVEWGASPVALAATLPARTAESLNLCGQFAAAWAAAAPDTPIPDLDHRPSMRDLAVTLMSVGLGETEAAAIATAWCDVEDWLRSSITGLMQREFRDAMAASDRDRLRTAALAHAPSSQRAHWVHGLSCVLDDEPLIVVDSTTRRGYRLTMSGIGDNFQLYTLLADRLIGAEERGLLPGDRPKDSWVRSATDGPSRFVDFADLPVRRFRMFDGHGNYVDPDGWPADIEPLDGTRLVVLHPPNGNYMRDLGRIFEQLAPTLTLERVLGADETASWLATAAPTRQDDLMAPRH